VTFRATFSTSGGWRQQGTDSCRVGDALGGDDRDDPISTRPGPGLAGPGRDEALSRLFEAHYPDMVRLAFYLTGSWAVGEELAQEAFVRLWRRWVGCATSTPLSAICVPCWWT
jgi:hypothetical protein